jgi:hypothetical protein
MLTLWLLWHMRNAIVFDNAKLVVSDLVDQILDGGELPAPKS